MFERIIQMDQSFLHENKCSLSRKRMLRSAPKTWRGFFILWQERPTWNMVLSKCNHEKKESRQLKEWNRGSGHNAREVIGWRSNISLRNARVNFWWTFSGHYQFCWLLCWQSKNGCTFKVQRVVRAAWCNKWNLIFLFSWFSSAFCSSIWIGIFSQYYY